MRQDIVLADCAADELKSFMDGLNESRETPFVCKSIIANGIRKGKLSEIKRYLTYFVTGWRTFLKRKKYGVIIGWQQFYALIICFWCSVFHVKKRNTVVALNYTYKPKKGIRGKIYHWFMKKSMNPKYLDCAHVPSNQYADILCETFHFPRERVLVTTFGIDDIYARWKDAPAPDGYEKNGYALAIGRSNRDFDFLIRAWESIAFPLVIVSDSYTRKEECPPNVHIIKNVAGDGQYPWIVNSRMVVIPIRDGTICSGDTVLLTSLSFGKNVIVTSPSTLGEMYITAGENGFLVEKNEDCMRELVQKILTGVADVSENARHSFLTRFTREALGCNVDAFLSKKPL